MDLDREFERNPQLAFSRALWRLDALDEWRDKIERRLGDCERTVDGMSRAEEVAAAVAAQLRRERTLQLTFVQKAIAAFVALVAVADGIRGLIS